MQEEGWKGPPPRPSILQVVGECIEGLLSWRLGLEIGGIVIVLLLVHSASTPVPGGNRGEAKVTRAKGDLKQIADQVKLFAAEQNRYPKSMAELVDRPEDAKDWPDGGYLENLPKDPWGGDYNLVVPANNPKHFEVISLGAENVPGGDDFDADLHFPKDSR